MGLVGKPVRVKSKLRAQWWGVVTSESPDGKVCMVRVIIPGGTRWRAGELVEVGVIACTEVKAI